MMNQLLYYLRELKQKNLDQNKKRRQLRHVDSLQYITFGLQNSAKYHQIEESDRTRWYHH